MDTTMFLPDVTQQFWDELLITKDMLKNLKRTSYSNNIIFKNYMIFGLQGSGKTTLANSIVKKYFDEYGMYSVCAVESSSGNLQALYSNIRGFDVNILFADNLTLRTIDSDTLAKFFTLRHTYGEIYPKGKEKGGVLLFLLGLHRFHGSPPEIRSNLDGIIIKDTPLFGWDRAFFKRLVGENVLEKLDYISRERLKKPELFEYAYFVGRTTSGFIRVGMNKKFYFESTW